MLKEYISQFWKGEPVENRAVLVDMLRRAGKVFHRQLMEPRSEQRAGGSYPPSAATKCVRANYGAWVGAPAEQFDAAARGKFLGGDLAELVALGVVNLAIASTKHSIGLNNEYVEIPLGSGEEKRRGFIDGMLNFNHDQHEALGHASCRPAKKDWVGKDGDENLLVEIKSMDDYPYQQFLKNGPDDTWGYLGQITVYQRALHLRRYVYLAVHRGSYEIAEHVGLYDPRYAELADKNYDAVMAGAKVGKPPEIPVGSQHGYDENGCLRLLCRFCSRKEWCYGLKGLALEAREGRGFGGKPTVQWYVKSDGVAQPSQDELDPGAIANSVLAEAAASRTKKTTKKKETA